jgi:tetratricopeptide (TPR) repeat protein
VSATGATPERRSPWLFGPVPDLLFGCGVLYLLILVGLSFAGSAVRLAQPLVLFPILTLLISAPHYGATILRVYEHRRDRRSYSIFSVWATVFVLAWFLYGTFDHRAGSWLLTLFLTWSPWHYTGQNYGISVMFLRRAGAPLDPTTKRALYASFVLSFLVTALLIHGSVDPFGYDVVNGATGNRAIRFVPLGVPASFNAVAVPALAVAWIAATLVAGLRLASQAPLGALAPVAWLVATHTLWFGVPFLLLHFGLAPVESLDFDFRTYYFMWIALAHAAQYLWVTSFYARAGSDWAGPGRYYRKTLLAGESLFILPILLVAPFGALSADAGLALLVSAAVNVHHFILDGAIWKLRNLRIAKVLIRSDRSDDDPAAEPRTRLRGPIWGVAAACTAAGVFVLWTDFVSVPRHARAGDHVAVARSLDRLGWLGFDHESKRAQLASDLLEAGRIEAAARQARRSLALRESPEGWRLLGDAQFRSRAYAAAAESYARGLALEQDSLPLLLRLAQAKAATGENDRARDLVQRAASLVDTTDTEARATIDGLAALLASRAER